MSLDTFLITSGNVVLLPSLLYLTQGYTDMKKHAQLVCTLLFISIVVKSFVNETNLVDAIALVATASIYCMYEFLTEQRTIKRFNLYKKETAARLDSLQKDLDGTKNKVSSINMGQAIRR